VARVLIVAKTRMGEFYTCVGGIDLETNENVRLLRPGNSNQPSSTPFNVGQVWEIEYIRRHDIFRPHIEDILVQRYQYSGQLTNLNKILLQRMRPWRGGINELFGGLLTLQNGKGYVSINKELPNTSTGYWIPDKPLCRSELDDKIYYMYVFENLHYAIKYVGFTNSVEQIPAGALVRVSLARWFRPSGASEERCYLQVSGWYT
jgi:hypothetical protein